MELISVLRFMMYRARLDQRDRVDLFHWGLLLANMSVSGLYLGKVFNEVKQRPLYVVQQWLNIDQPEVAPVGAVQTSSDGFADRERAD